MTEIPVSVFKRNWAWPALATLVCLVLGIVALYGPTYYSLATGLWQTDEQAHGFILFLIVLWLVWQVAPDVLDAPVRPAVVTGFLALLFGLACYVLGRSQDFVPLDIGSQIPVVAGLLLILSGWTAVRRSWFVLLYMIFLVPLPGVIIDTVTQPLKLYISIIAEHTLYFAGLPIARSGNILTVGPYQLEVANACSGLHSMFSLSALGLLYMYITRRKSLAHNAIMLLSILPVAFAANVVRVMILILVTYFMGDEAGQGFLHGFAGILLMIAALFFLFVLDWVLSLIFGRSSAEPERS